MTVTPENFLVAVLRPTQTKSQVVTAALVKALAGAYKSCFVSVFPPHWQLALRRKGNSQLINHIIPSLWAMCTGSNTNVKVK
ncbi:MAG: hypothetical protein ACQZ3N_01315, partial [cyanobacterium endosymbiont of Rhopalodia yunnanensis]